MWKNISNYKKIIKRSTRFDGLYFLSKPQLLISKSLLQFDFPFFDQ